MQDTCSEALKSGETILKLTDMDENLSLDKAALVQVSRILLGSVTRSLLLADVVAVKKLVRAAEKVCFQINFLFYMMDLRGKNRKYMLRWGLKITNLLNSFPRRYMPNLAFTSCYEDLIQPADNA